MRFFFLASFQKQRVRPCFLSVRGRVRLCDPRYCSPPGSSVRGIFQARTLECVAISYSRRSSWPKDWTSPSCHLWLKTEDFDWSCPCLEAPWLPWDVCSDESEIRLACRGEHAPLTFVFHSARRAPKNVCPLVIDRIFSKKNFFFQFEKLLTSVFCLRDRHWEGEKPSLKMHCAVLGCSVVSTSLGPHRL